MDERIKIYLKHMYPAVGVFILSELAEKYYNLNGLTYHLTGFLTAFAGSLLDNYSSLKLFELNNNFYEKNRRA